MVHHERAARALERLGILCYDVAKPMKECGCQETIFTNSLVGTKTGGRPEAASKKLVQSEANLIQAEAALSEYKASNNPKSPQFYLDKMRTVLQGDDGWAGRERRIRNLRINARVTDSTYSQFVHLNPAETQSVLTVEFERKLTELQETNSGERRISTPIAPLPDVYLRFDMTNTMKLLKKPIESPELNEREQYLFSLVQSGETESLQQRQEFFSNDDVTFCPYCLQDITSEYRKSLSQSLTKVLNDIVKQHQEQLKDMLMPEIVLDLTPFSTLESHVVCDELVQKLNLIIQSNNALVQTKVDNPYTPVLSEIADINEDYTLLVESLEKLESEKNAFNQKITETQPIIDELTRINNEIAHYDIVGFATQYSKQIEEQNAAQATVDNAKNDHNADDEVLKALDAKRKSIDIAEDVINNGLKYIFFAEKRLSIVGSGDSYKLLSNGFPVSPKDVSVGERNIIGLCYFFTSILQGKDKVQGYKDEYLIVIDDPVSSYDFENKVGIHSFLKLKLGQLLSGNLNTRAIVMTHDLRTFFDLEKILQELQKNWNRAFKDLRTKYDLFELKNCTIDRFQYRKRHEYSELVKDVYSYGCGDAPDNEIIVGNIMRQVLEAFSTFVYKKGIEEVSNDNAILEVMCKEFRSYFQNLMYRLVLHSGSHREEQARSLEIDFFSVISEQEKRRTAKDVLCFMYILHPLHILAHLESIPNVDKELDSWCEDIKCRAVVI